MRSYIKIYGPPVLKAIQALEKVAVEAPKVCMMDTILERDMQEFQDKFNAGMYFQPYGASPERCEKIISRSGERLGQYDFFFEWFDKPSADELKILIDSIDAALGPIGCRYTITSL